MRSTFLAFALLLPVLPLAAHADVIVMPESDYAAPVSKPTKGSTMSAVVKQFGQPTTKRNRTPYRKSKNRTHQKKNPPSAGFVVCGDWFLLQCGNACFVIAQNETCFCD